ncbi:MAG TPA: hypothetical protein VN627_12530, partial [Novosphingobium sp.]|nr:hypothetical protein [Novosphingobium sp.]
MGGAVIGSRMAAGDGRSPPPAQAGYDNGASAVSNRAVIYRWTGKVRSVVQPSSAATEAAAFGLRPRRLGAGASSSG